MSIAGAPIAAADVVASKSATRRQIRGSSLLLVGRLLSKGVNFGVQVLIVRYLSKGDFGAFAYALGIVAIVQTVVTFGLDRAVTRFVPIYHEQGDYPKMFGTLLMVVITMAILGVSVIGGLYAAEAVMGTSMLDDARARSVVFILVLLGPLQALDGVMIGLFAVFASPRAIFFRKHVVAPLLKLAVVLALVFGGASVLFLATGYVAAELLGIVIYTVLLVRVMKGSGLLARFDRATVDIPWRTVLAFTVPLLTSDLVYVTMQSTNTIMLEHFGDTLQVASLRAVLPAAILNQLVFSSFATLFTPQAARMFAREDREGINDLYWQTAIWVAILSFPVFALTFALAGPFTTFVFGSEYADSGIILSLLALGYYFNVALGFNGLTLKVYGKVGYIVKLNVAVVIVNLVLSVLLIPRYGALGAAIGTAATLIVHNILKQAGLALGTGIRLFDRRYVPVYASIAVATAGMLVMQVGWGPPMVVSFAAAALISLALLRFNRRLLDVEETLPEIMRIPLAGRLLAK